MTNWAFETWPRILAGAAVLGSAFGVTHVLGRIVTGMPSLGDASTLAIAGLVAGGYVIIGAIHQRNPLPRQE